MGGVAAPRPAHADWPTVHVVVSGDGLPYRVAIRGWGPSNGLFFLVDRFFDRTNFFWNTCPGIACTGTCP